MKSTKLSLLLLCGVLAGCSLTTSETSYTLSEAKAQELSEAFLLALNEDVESTNEYLFDELEEKLDTLKDIVDRTDFHDPQNISISTVENSTEQSDSGDALFVSTVTGAFTCEGSDHSSDFTLTWLYNPEKAIWEIIDINLEEC